VKNNGTSEPEMPSTHSQTVVKNLGASKPKGISKQDSKIRLRLSLPEGDLLYLL
jgi:hypothetical protein